jgi:hypothetical protein
LENGIGDRLLFGEILYFAEAGDAQRIDPEKRLGEDFPGIRINGAAEPVLGGTVQSGRLTHTLEHVGGSRKDIVNT